MAKLKLLDFDNFKFETELASESFYIKPEKIIIATPFFKDYNKARISLICRIFPISNNIQYLVSINYIDHITEEFTSLIDAINYYNNKLKELKELKNEKELIQ